MTNFNERVKPNTTVKYSKRIIPSVVISDLALSKMFIYTDEVKDEVGWLGTATRDENNVITLHDVYLFKQQVHGATTEITPEGLQEFATELLSLPNGLDIWNNMKMWGHSHVNMGITPSGQDNAQMEEFSKIGHDFFVRLICNKKGDLGIDVYDYEKGFEFHNVPWVKETRDEVSPIQQQILELQAQLEQLAKEAKEEEEASLNELREPIKAEIKEKVSKFVYTAPKTVGNTYWKPVGSTGRDVNTSGFTTTHQTNPNITVGTRAGSSPYNKHNWENRDAIDGVAGTVHDYFSQKEIIQLAYHCESYEDLVEELYADGLNTIISYSDVDQVWTEVQRVQLMSGIWEWQGGYY